MLGLDGMLIDFQGQGGNNLGGGGGGGGSAQPPMGFIDFPQPPALPVLPQAKPFAYPTPGTSSNTHNATPPFNYNIPPYPTLDQEKKDLNTQFISVCFDHLIDQIKSIRNRQFSYTFPFFFIYLIVFCMQNYELRMP